MSEPASNGESFEARISREARRFELKPLLDLLAAKGYDRHEILFEGTHEGSSSSLIQSVRFQSRPSRCVVVTLSLGLLGDNSLLPSYFLQVAEASPDPDRFFDFIRFFDHRLIDNLLHAVAPEDCPSTYRDYRQVQLGFFKMLGVGSVSTLHWLGQLYFPELRVRVSRRAFAHSTASHAFRTGESRLDGTGIVGRVYESEATGFVIDLIAEDETDDHGRTWPGIVRARLHARLLPLIAPMRISLMVRLRVLHHASWSRVDFPFADEHGYLGYERIRDEGDGGHTVVIYSGVTGETGDEGGRESSDVSL